MGSSVEVVRQKSIVIATLNRPDKLNALNKEAYEDLERLVDVLETDAAARVLVVTGAGEKAFCAGADLKERNGMNEKDILVRLEFVRRLYMRLENLPMPVIAAVNGMALGGGTELALACDLRIASDLAVFGLPEVDLAIIPGTGGTQRLPRLVGPAKALEMILMAKRIQAYEALRIGMVNLVVPGNRVMPNALEWAEKMLQAGPIALKQAKAAIKQGMEQDLEEGLRTELKSYKACLYSKDRLEGLKAFKEKRKPEYRGE
ncbi:MAG: enoyl-CoA hydratase/isomerase family protein [Bdellovibrionales bacterium]|nr:enoyl-CoA hydratase/isomerase family protein [Bdellovibrionales bacterium]